jgi:hypothetical protein
MYIDFYFGLNKQKVTFYYYYTMSATLFCIFFLSFKINMYEYSKPLKTEYVVYNLSLAKNFEYTGYYQNACIKKLSVVL